MVKNESFNAFIDELKKYIHCNNGRNSLKLKGMSPLQFRTHSQAINIYFCLNFMIRFNFSPCPFLYFSRLTVCTGLKACRYRITL